MDRYKQILFVLILVLIALPFFQKHLKLFDTEPLNGSFKKAAKPTFTPETYFEGTYQTAYNDYYEEQIGFRPFFVRVNNQISFSLFDTALANDVVIGKHNYLYEKNYIKAYYGEDFIGQDVIQNKVKRLKKIQRYFEDRGTHLLVILAPGKASFYPEYIPDNLKGKETNETNYYHFKVELRWHSVNHIDMNAWFMKAKDTSRYVLYPKTGIHWSSYGVGLVVDSLMAYMDKYTDKPLVGVEWDRIDMSSEPRGVDNDIERGMNLLFNIPQPTLAYPHYVFRDDSTHYKPKVAVIADSFFWNLFGTGLAARIWDFPLFWYYFKQEHNMNRETIPIDKIDVLDKAVKQDYIILMATEANLYKFPFGFIDTFEKLILEKESDFLNSDAFKKMIEANIKGIKEDKQWYEDIKQKAIRNNRSVEEQIFLDAEWLAKENWKKSLKQ